MADQETESVRLTPDELDLLEVSTALYGWGTQAEAFEAVRKAVEHIVADRQAARLTPWEVLRRAAQTVTGHEREWLLVQADGWEASGLVDRPDECRHTYPSPRSDGICPSCGKSRTQPIPPVQWRVRHVESGATVLCRDRNEAEAHVYESVSRPWVAETCPPDQTDPKGVGRG